MCQADPEIPQELLHVGRRRRWEKYRLPDDGPTTDVEPVIRVVEKLSDRHPHLFTRSGVCFRLEQDSVRQIDEIVGYPCPPGPDFVLLRLSAAIAEECAKARDEGQLALLRLDPLFRLPASRSLLGSGARSTTGRRVPGDGSTSEESSPDGKSGRHRVL